MLDITHAYDLRDSDIELPSIIPRVGALIGNTRAAWPHFVAARRDEPDPFDRWVERLHPGALYSHRQYDGAFLPFQRLAIASGLAAASPCGMLVHPIYGQWFALRAIIAVDVAPVRRPVDRACICTDACSTPGLPARDACSTGREYRYTNDQIDFHYASLRRKS